MASLIGTAKKSATWDYHKSLYPIVDFKHQVLCSHMFSCQQSPWSSSSQLAKPQRLVFFRRSTLRHAPGDLGNWSGYMYKQPDQRRCDRHAPAHGSGSPGSCCCCLCVENIFQGDCGRLPENIWRGPCTLLSTSTRAPPSEPNCETSAV